MTKEKDAGDAKAITSLVLGIVGMVSWLIPVLGLPIPVIGLIRGIRGVKSNKRGMAITGIVLCSIGLVLSIFYILVLFMGMMSAQIRTVVKGASETFSYYSDSDVPDDLFPENSTPLNGGSSR